MKKDDFNLRMLFPMGLLFLISNMMHQSQIYPYSPARFLFVLLGSLLALPLYWLIGRAAALCNEDGLFDTLEVRFGRFLSVLTAALFTIASLVVASTFLRTYAELISLISLRDVPLFFITLPLAITSFCLIVKGRSVLGRWCHFVLPVVLGLLVLGFALSFKNANFDYLSPFLYGEENTVLLRSAQTMLTSFSQGTLLLVPACACKNREKAGRTMVWILIIGALLLAASALQNILLLGPSEAKITYFTAFSAFSLIDISPLFQRMEILVFVLLLIAAIASVSLCFWVSESALSHMTRGRFRKTMVGVIFVLISIVSPILLPTITDVFRPIGATWIYFFLFHVLLPLAVVLLLFFGARRRESPLASENKNAADA